jgi:hypothetical protein
LTIQHAWPVTLNEAVNIVLTNLTPEEKEVLKYTPQDRLVWFDFDWALNLQNDFGLSQGNTALIEDCGAADPDCASLVIVEAVWNELNRQPQ